MSYSGSSTRNGYINTQAWLAHPVFVADHPNNVAEMQRIMQAAGLSLEGQTLQCASLAIIFLYHATSVLTYSTLRPVSNDQSNPHDVASAEAAEMVRSSMHSKTAIEPDYLQAGVTWSNIFLAQPLGDNNGKDATFCRHSFFTVDHNNSYARRLRLFHLQ